MLFDFRALSARERHRLLISAVVPRPIAWVVTEDPASGINLAPFSFFNVFCEEPALVCLGFGAGERGDGAAKDTAANIQRTGEFVVNLVAEANAAAMIATAMDVGSEIDEMAAAGLTPAPSACVRPPRIAESPVALECRRHSAIELPAGRLLVIGEVLCMQVRDAAVVDAAQCRIDTPSLGLIARAHGDGWYLRTTDWFRLPTPRAGTPTAR